MKYKAFLLTIALITLPGCKESKKCNDSTCTQPTVQQEESMQPGITHTESSQDTLYGTPQNPEDMEVSIPVRI